MITVGSRVVCIDSRFPIQVLEWGNNLPREGHVYTVRDIRFAPDGITGEYGRSYHLHELNNRSPFWHGELSFDARRFKELQMEEDASASNQEGAACVLLHRGP